ncbi:hypothetical protein [Legionella clemsonensis]|uniref:Uncharacterized protein n=1 Tax=Legionella clemsonensis TaxID=1867846 RepID=A0A222NZL5_9GAMM|nr:hypothetical protein [Legionella clemsonensis]ASQ45044.1 hypothetical protein clem_02410 [Legionella clemsonensis]
MWFPLSSELHQKNVTENSKNLIRCLINNVTEDTREIDYGEAVDEKYQWPGTTILKKRLALKQSQNNKLIIIMNKLNDRPRKTLGFKTPAMLSLSETNDEKSAVALAS